MDKSTIKKLRNELHHLAKDRKGVLPLRVVGSTTNYSFSEADCCFLWDDESEILYIVMPNTVHTQTTDSRLYPMQIFTMAYESITFISVAVDRLCLDNFFKDKISKGLTNEETRKRYFNDITALYDERTYFMGDPSPTTEKRGLQPDDEIVDKNATKFL